MAATSRIRGLRSVALFAVVAYPVSLHLLIANGRTTAALWVLLAAAGVYFLSVLRAPRSLLAQLVGPGMMLMALIGLLLDATAALYLPPVLISGTLLQVFGHSLLPGNEPLISRFARRVDGIDDPRSMDYTRGLTWFWTLAFAAILIESVLLALFAPLEIWSLFTNLLNYAIIAALFVLEYIYRLLYFRRPPSLRSILSAVKPDKLRRWKSG